ncbi:hypothetical protein Tco_0274206, partial [Tanacetum coccineum]
QSCLLHHLRLPTLPSTTILSQGGYFGEVSDGGSPRVIVYEYDGLPMQPLHDPDYGPEPMYHEYIPLEDEHVFLAEEQPLPHVVLPTAERKDEDDDDGDSSEDDAEDEDQDKDEEDEE